MDREKIDVVLSILRDLRHSGRRFGMGAYVTHLVEGKRMRGFLPEPGDAVECCAIGWAAQDPGLISQGFHLRIVGADAEGDKMVDDRFGSAQERRNQLLRAGADPETLDVMPAYQSAVGLQAIAMFFGTSVRVAGHCFLPSAYRAPAAWSEIQPEHVIARIEAEMRGHYGR